MKKLGPRNFAEAMKERQDVPEWLRAMQPAMQSCRSAVQAWELLGTILAHMGVCERCRGDGSVMMTMDRLGIRGNTGDYGSTECPDCKGTGRSRP